VIAAFAAGAVTAGCGPGGGLAGTLDVVSLPQPPTMTHCYRHPDREAGRRCTRCGKPACSECLVQATVGSHCLDCVKQAQPDIKTRVKYASARQPTLVTSAIIAVNIAVFVWVIAGDSAALTLGFGGSGGVTKRQFELGLNRLQLTLSHEWYRLVSNGFLHFGVIHIAFNMYLLYLLGQLLERELGRVKFGMLYFAALLGGSAGVMLMTGLRDVGINGGASGAVFGLMGAAVIATHRRGINILQTQLGMLLVVNLVLTFFISGISIGGHIGGLVAGVICGWVMLAPNWKPAPNWAKYATPAIVGIAAIGISVWIAKNP